MKPYILKRLDDEIAILNITENGLIEDYKLFNNNKKIRERNCPGFLKLCIVCSCHGTHTVRNDHNGIVADQLEMLIFRTVGRIPQ